jgi:viologen exporter family transport system permease protein
VIAMRSALALYLRYLEVCLRSKLEYRASLLMQVLGSLLVTAIEFVGVWALFARFGSLGGWTLPQVALLYGMVETTFAVSDLMARGFDAFPALLASGDFDRLLVRPRSTALQLAGQDLALKSVGRGVQALAVLGWAAVAIGVPWSAAKAGLLILAIAGGVCLFCGIVVAQAAMAFWTVEPLEIMNAFSYGGVEAAHYPMTVYRPWFRRFFTFVVPLACVIYLPGLVIMERSDPLGTPVALQWLAPLGGPLFLVAALQLWRLGVRRYMSAGG